MQIVNMRDLKLHTRQVIQAMLSDGYAIITRRGRPIAMMTPIPEKEISDAFNALRQRMRKTAEKAGYSLKDVPRIIAEARARYK